MTTPPNPPTLDLEAEPELCDRCAWPLKQSTKNGCTAGNCAQRPMPPERTIFSRAEYIAMRNRRDEAARELERLKAEAAELRAEVERQKVVHADTVRSYVAATEE